MFCGQCGAKLKADAKFCGQCGAKVLEEDYQDSYKLKELIGKGGFGKVFKAEKNGSPEAVKIIDILPANSKRAKFNPSLKTASLEKQTTDLIKEIDMLNCLKGDSHIVNYIDHHVKKEEDSYELAIEMECLKPLNEGLGEILQPEAIKKMLYDLLDGLETMEKHDIVHGDIKPNNIMVDDYGHVKFTDFGISKVLSEYERTDRYTPAYASREVLEKGEYSFASDLYSLGLVIYQMFNGNKLPFMESKSLDEMLSRRFTEELPKAEGMDREFYAFLKKALSNDKEARFQNAAEMKAELDSLYKENHIPQKVIVLSELLLIASQLSGLKLATGVLEIGNAVAEQANTVSKVRESVEIVKAASEGTGAASKAAGGAAGISAMKMGIGVACLVVALVGGGVFVSTHKNSPQTKEETTQTETKSTETNKSPEDDLNEYITRIEEYLTNDQGEEALGVIKEAHDSKLSEKDLETVDSYIERSTFTVYDKLISDMEDDKGELKLEDWHLEGTYVSAVDFDQDGIDELLLAYDDVDQPSHYSYSIYYLNTDEYAVKSLYEGSDIWIMRAITGMGGSYLPDGIEITKYNGKYAMLTVDRTDYNGSGSDDFATGTYITKEGNKVETGKISLSEMAELEEAGYGNDTSDASNFTGIVYEYSGALNCTEYGTGVEPISVFEPALNLSEQMKDLVNEKKG